MHLKNAVLALQVLRKLVSRLEGVRSVRNVHFSFFDPGELVIPARRVHVVPARVVGIDWASAPIVRSTGQRVQVEALLSGHTFRIVEVLNITDAEFEVALWGRPIRVEWPIALKVDTAVQ